MVRLDVHQQGGYHGHGLLPRDGPRIILAFHHLMYEFQRWHLAQLRSGKVEMPCQIIGVPWKRLWGLKNNIIELQQSYTGLCTAPQLLAYQHTKTAHIYIHKWKDKALSICFQVMRKMMLA